MNNIDKILEKTFQQMPNIFTSNQFALRLKVNGAPQDVVTNGMMLVYLRRYADKFGNSPHRTRTWIKRNPMVHQQAINFELNDEMCIQHLKNKGYRILKMQEIEL